jgi:hypothetical protein
MIAILSIFQAPNTCTCATGWTGSICETREYFVRYSSIFYLNAMILANCTLPCLHSGVCVSQFHLKCILYCN